MQIVAMKDMATGNESVGTMWQETKIFDAKDSLLDVMKWAGDRKTRVTITVPDNDAEDFSNQKFDF